MVEGPARGWPITWRVARAAADAGRPGPARSAPMIRVSRLNGDRFIVNAELIKFVEEVPDTVITLRDGEKLMVREPAEEVAGRVIAYGRALRCPDG